MNQTQSKVLLTNANPPPLPPPPPSKNKIKSKYITAKPFSFRPVIPKDVLDVISTLADTTPSGGDIPLRILRGNKIFSQFLCK